jgi:hypothetical protein
MASLQGAAAGGGDEAVVKAVGVERENVKTERLLASVGERESKLELPLVRKVRRQLQEARSEEAYATWGWVRREARWEAEFVEGASGEQAGWRPDFILMFPLPLFLLFLSHSQDACRQLSQKVEELQGSVGSGVRRKRSRVGLETPGWRNWRRR